MYIYVYTSWAESNPRGKTEGWGTRVYLDSAVEQIRVYASPPTLRFSARVGLGPTMYIYIHAFFDSHVSQSQNVITLKAPCSRQRLWELVKVLIEKLDDRSGERIVRTQILKRFVLKSLLTDVPVIL